MNGLARCGRVHLLGICGTGMASLAGLLQGKGLVVSGSDQNVYPPMSEMLSCLGIEVHTPYRPENIPADVDLVIVGNAISRGNAELEEVLDRGLPYASMAEVLKEGFLRGRRSVVVAGTHGKTTTTALGAWVLDGGGREPGFLIGGLPRNFRESYRDGGGDLFIIEGDEYDTAYFDKGPKFLHYLPDMVVLGNVEYDHADIYPDLAAVRLAFERLINLIPRRGLLIVGADSPAALECAAKAFCRVETFSVTGSADWSCRLLESGCDTSRFEVLRKGAGYGVFEGPFWGSAGLRNALAVVAVAAALGVDQEAISESLRTFKGVRRRMEVLGERKGVIVVEDFAHHPTAVRETLHASRLRWPGRRIWAVFEPRSFTSRSNVFQAVLPDAFRHADRVVIARVYASARLPKDRELSEEALVSELTARGKAAWFIPTPQEIISFLVPRVRQGDVVLAMSNGAFGNLCRKLLAALE